MMDTPDRPDETLLPARRSPAHPLVPPAAEPSDDYGDVHQATGKKVSLRLIGRALCRHWWQATLLWMAGSAGLLTLAYYKVKPTYDAISRVRVEVGDFSIFAQNSNAPIDFTQYMETQVSNVTSPTVIGTALAAHPDLTGYPVLRGALDPEAEIRHALRVGIVPRTSLIQVEMSSESPAEAAAIVNAVVEAYLKHAQATYDASTQKRIDQLKGTRDEQLAEVDRQRRLVEELHKNIGAANVDAIKDRNVASLDKYRQWSEQLTSVEIMRIAAKAKLDQLRDEKSLPARPQESEQIKLAVIDAFYADPQVSVLQVDIERAESKLKDIERRVRSQSDPARVMAAQRIKDLSDRKDDLWRKLEPRLRRQVTPTPTDVETERAIKESEANLAALATQEDTLRGRLDQVRIENKTAEGEALKLEFARRDLQRAEDVFETILKNLNQLQFEAKSPIARINLEFLAKASSRPNSDRRTSVMAMVPLVTGLLVIGLMVTLELRGARVSDPEELASRVNVQVIGVVPPLPQLRTSRGGNGPPATAADFRAQRALDEFVQSLDHLRVALCARRDPWGRDRHCVLITSACGSEGKTTLAAQLAERCVNAGLMTLLIDADLRNPTLSRMLDASDNPGLINVLRGEVMAEDVVMVVGDAGGFHLLPSGTPRVDPSRLLQSDRLGKLLAQARESFDMIIVDAPPVLPVPDALTIGRWTDGAVLAVRYDTSRFPLVERANRRLAHVGVPVIGAVVNGVRSMESAYGGYYAYGYGGAYGSNGVSTSGAPSSKS
jgi:succinoglycan biosynthesis transport protein ExoP